jgi:hypothetical protein
MVIASIIFTCAHRTSSASLSGNFVRAVRLCTFHRRVRLLKKGSMLPASNDNFVELAAGKGAILSAPSQLRGLASKPAVAQQQQDAGHTALQYPSGRPFQHLAGLERACEDPSPFIRQ